MSDPLLLRALTEALSDPQAFLAVVMDSADRDPAVAALQDRYGWDEVEAMAVLDMQFRRATRADRDLIASELERLTGRGRPSNLRSPVPAPAGTGTGMGLRAIATPYSGITFVSTLEADWAKNLDAAGIRWNYEPEGVKLPNGTNYRPDFYLPRVTTWLEVKGPHDQRIDKAHGLAVACLHAPGCSDGTPADTTTVNPHATCSCGFGTHFPWRLVVVGRPGEGGRLTFHGAPHPRWPDPQIVLNRCFACHQVSFVDAASGLRICRRCHSLDPAGFTTDGAWAEGVHSSGSLGFARVEPPRGRRSRGRRSA